MSPVLWTRNSGNRAGWFFCSMCHQLVSLAWLHSLGGGAGRGGAGLEGARCLHPHIWCSPHEVLSFGGWLSPSCFPAWWLAAPKSTKAEAARPLIKVRPRTGVVSITSVHSVGQSKPQGQPRLKRREADSAF